MTKPPPPPGKSSIGLDEHLAGALAYVFGPLSGVVFLLVGEQNRFVRFHALQSIFTFVALGILRLLIGGVPVLNWVLLPGIFGLATVVLWLFLIFKAATGQRYKVPFLGDWADQQVQ
jgi:uncharacterized membrane protein